MAYSHAVGHTDRTVSGRLACSLTHHGAAAPAVLWRTNLQGAHTLPAAVTEASGRVDLTHEIMGELVLPPNASRSAVACVPVRSGCASRR